MHFQAWQKNSKTVDSHSAHRPTDSICTMENIHTLNLCPDIHTRNFTLYGQGTGWVSFNSDRMLKTGGGDGWWLGSCGRGVSVQQSYASEKRCVLRDFLNLSTVSTVRIPFGSLFQILGAAYLNAFSVNLYLLWNSTSLVSSSSTLRLFAFGFLLWSSCLM